MSSNFDLVCVGGGIAGMVAGVRAAERGLRVAVLEKGAEDRYPCNTRWSGGIIHISYADPTHGDAVVREAINQLPHQHTAIYLNPEDASVVRSHIGDQLTHAGHRIFEDVAIARGGCKVEAGGSQIDATVPTRWGRIVESLVDGAEWMDHE